MKILTILRKATDAVVAILFAALVVLVLLVSGALSVPLDAISTLFMKLFNFIFMVPSSLRFIY